MPVSLEDRSLLGYQLRLESSGVAFDEMLGPDGLVRSHWKEAAAYFEKLGPDEIARRWQQARKILHDNGVAYNAHSKGSLRSWELNPVPLCLPTGEWKSIDAAIRQRARLLNHVLNDIHGERELLRDKILPAPLILGSSAYQRPCRGLAVRDDARLVVYAADLARSPDGSWWVVSDRTQAPSGMGYALENRLVLSRVFPEIFRDSHIARLGSYFEKFRSSLAALTPRPGSEPMIVLLTPGSLSETYFEHAYLARQLGCPLVQGQDLAVREDKVYIKTLDGLRQVDVIIRRVDEEYCDPLELRDDSLLGVPGLVGAVRAGTVTMANALGCGVVQGSALSAFLPALCRHVFSEDLLMPSVATWWCGDDPARRYVLNNLHGLVLKDSFEYFGERPEANLVSPGMRDLLRRRPEYFSAQENVRLSRSPDFLDGRLESRSILLRVFAVRVGDDYEVMPGGLTRVADEESSYNVLFQQTGGSKDTWVECDGTEEAPGPPPAMELRRSHLELTSRVADNLFWLGRYAERADFTARIVRCSLENFSEEPGWVEQNDVMPLLDTLRHFDQFTDPNRGEAMDQALARQMLDANFPGSLHALLQRLQALGATVRDQISNDTWRAINILGDHSIFGDAQTLNETALQLSQVIHALSAFQGLLNENMPHGHAWRFLDFGRRIERAMYLSRFVAEMLRKPKPHSTIGRFELLLETQDALVTYRQKHASLRAPAVLDFVLCDETNPRSLSSQLMTAMDHLQNLPREAGALFRLPEERCLLACLSDVRLVDPLDTDTLGGIVALLERMEQSLSECSELTSLRFFTHLRTSSLGRDAAVGELPSSI